MTHFIFSISDLYRFDWDVQVLVVFALPALALLIRPGVIGFRPCYTSTRLPLIPPVLCFVLVLLVRVGVTGLCGVLLSRVVIGIDVTGPFWWY